MGAYLMQTLRAVTRKFPEVELTERNTDQDHIHVLASIPPKYAVCDVVQYLKGKSAHAMRRKFPFLNNVY